MAGSGALPDLDNRADYVYSLEYLKKVISKNKEAYERDLEERSRFGFGSGVGVSVQNA